jgi:hypothetical protein
MQYLDYRTNQQWQSVQLTQYALLIVLSLLIWFIPVTHTWCTNLDLMAFNAFNGSLLYSRPWQLLWGYLNHPNETWLNVVWMFAVNVVGIFSLHSSRRRKATAGVMYFWLFFQLVLLVTHKLFNDWIEVGRASPSMVLNPWVVLTDALNIPTLKVTSSSCFPAGHALVLIFWAQFTNLYSKPWVHKLSWTTAVVLTLPRLFSGAHWLSDIIFTVFYAQLWFILAHGTPFFAYATNKLEKFLTIFSSTK